MITAYVHIDEEVVEIAVYNGKKRVTMTPEAWEDRARIVGLDAEGETMMLLLAGNREEKAYRAINTILHYLRPYINSGKRVAIACNSESVIAQLKGEEVPEGLEELKAITYRVAYSLKHKAQLFSISTERTAKAVL